ncbi:FCD domain-containing protein [Aureimonas ureilytica]|uniref:FCD domain-containing protein n=1 Tax=Aureimonas ureilytica TaxID=401562 RepID=UPI000369D9E0|nr:FCD domain-containing protein [Aureimonas ureilytica]
MEREGWAERRAGRGWSLAAIGDKTEACREILEAHRTIEPAGILSAGFKVDKPTLRACRARHSLVLDRGLITMDRAEVSSNLTDFHVKVMAMSGNRFYVQTLQRLISLRSLADCGHREDRGRDEIRCLQHVGILDALLDDDRRRAGELMRSHLEPVPAGRPSAD